MGWTITSNLWSEIAVGVNPPTLTNFPVLVSETSDVDLKTTANGGKVTNSSGYDIIFTDSSEVTKLNHEIERYIATTGEIAMWVKVPTLSATANTTLYMYFSNSSVSSSQENKTGVWDSNYGAVWHLQESGNGTAGEYVDSTSNGNNGRGGAGTASNVPAQATGRIGYGEQFDGTNDLIDAGTGASIKLSSGGTIETWMYETGTGGNYSGRLLDRSTGTSGQGGYAFQGCNGSHSLPSELWLQINSSGNSTTPNSITASQWIHAVWEFDGVEWLVFLNGALNTTVSSTELPGTGSIRVYIAIVQAIRIWVLPAH